LLKLRYSFGEKNDLKVESLLPLIWLNVLSIVMQQHAELGMIFKNVPSTMESS